MRFNWSFLLSHLPEFGPALVLALKIFALSVALAFVWGIVLAVAKGAQGPIRWLAAAYIELYRNTPLLVQLYFVFFGLPAMGIALTPLASGVLALAAQHGAFFAEILRGAIQGISDRQREAGKALGMPSSLVMRLVILPQAVRDSIPAAGNQVVQLLQDTSLVSTIGVIEITAQGYAIAERTAASFEMFVAVGAIYLIVSTVLSIGLRTVEHSLRVVR